MFAAVETSAAIDDVAWSLPAKKSASHVAAYFMLSICYQESAWNERMRSSVSEERNGIEAEGEQ